MKRACSPAKDSDSTGGPPDVATRRIASREVRRFSECCVQPAVGGTGSPFPPRPRRFRLGLRFVPAAVPRAVSHASSSSRKLHASSETPLSCPPHASRRGAPSLGLAFPLRDISRPRRCDGFPCPPPSVLSVPPAPDGFLRNRPCRFISPRSHVQDSPTRSSSSHSRDGSSTPLCPLVVGSSSLPPVARRRHVPEPRPQGFAPCESSGAVATVFSRRVGPPPRGFILLQVLPLLA